MKMEPDRFAKLVKKENVTDEGFAINESYRPIALTLQEKFKELKDAPIKNILFVDNLNSKKKAGSKVVFAEIGKIPRRWQDVLHQTTGLYFEFVLTVYRENTANMTRAQIVALIYHELRHIRRDDVGNKIVGHDVEDWYEMYTKLGYNWATTLGDIPDLLGGDVDWDSIEGPAALFTADGEPHKLRVVK
jgi:predicted metallopeptidase